MHSYPLHMLLYALHGKGNTYINFRYLIKIYLKHTFKVETIDTKSK